MANPVAQREALRVPNLPMGKIVDPNGMPTDDELQFRQTLVTLLQSILGNEGLVMPQQSVANVTTIQNHIQDVPGASTNIYTCQFGTMIYETGAAAINDEVIVAVNSGTNNAPIFKQFLLADNQTLNPTAGAIAGYVLSTFNGVQYKIALYAI